MQDAPCQRLSARSVSSDNKPPKIARCAHISWQNTLFFNPAKPIKVVKAFLKSAQPQQKTIFSDPGQSCCFLRRYPWKEQQRSTVQNTDPRAEHRTKKRMLFQRFSPPDIRGSYRNNRVFSNHRTAARRAKTKYSKKKRSRLQNYAR